MLSLWMNVFKYIFSNADNTCRIADNNDVDNEAQLIQKLFLSAREGEWLNVWEILGTPEHPVREILFNVIPENRRWGILHQAVFWEYNQDVLRQLLKYDACDSRIRAKDCISECGKTTRMTAMQIAVAYNHKLMSDILLKHTNCNFDRDIPTFEPYESYTQNKGLGLVSVTLAAYKVTFHPKPVDPEKSITVVLQDIFQDIMASDDRRMSIQEKVSDSVYVVCEEQSKIVKRSGSREEFFINIIKTYSCEENFMYTHLNMAFRRQREKHYRPTGDDLALGPYAVMYQMLLLFWPNIDKESTTTYRRMLLTTQDAEKYQVGIKLVWQSVVSSSVHLKNAMPFPTCGKTKGNQAVIFTIDNSANSPWQPRNIENYSMYMEYERTYPAGAKFRVTGRSKKGSDIYIDLKLLRY